MALQIRIRRSRLPLLLKKAKRTQLDLALFLGVSQPFISQVSNNKEVFSYEMAANAALFLGCSMEDLYEMEHVSS
ncbi:helix-turn-helix transcriptional regulator [Gorillibacterium sp. sgz5001074]|uniref:helix-turn-helix transcriptional regulator n=1 Tax=Gorillibacterium sp. sgz5001074 TaxID=3446695 RepID=UPI003F662088